MGAEDSPVIMMVKDVMTRELITIGPDTPCEKARRLMEDHHIRHLPVVESGRLIGMVSDRDVRSASVHTAAVARQIMSQDPLTVRPDTRVEHAGRLMLDARIGSLPVVHGGTLAGIVTYTDLLNAFVHVIEMATEERIAIDLVGIR